MKIGTLIACCGVPAMLAVASSAAFAQGAPPVPNIGDAVRQSEETRRAAPVPPAAAAPILPRLVEPQFTLKDKSTLFVRSFRVDSPKLVSEAELRAIVAPYQNRKLTIAEIYEVADKITTLYRNQGYLVAKAYVPAQDARRGVLRIKIVAGKYGAVTVKNQSLVRDWFLQGVIDHALAGSAFIHNAELERAMLLISDLPGAGVPRVAIGSGRQPETSDFVFDVPQGRLLDGYVLADNFGSPYTGRDRVSGGLNLNSPLGFGDRLSGFGIFAEENELVNGRIAYSAPIGYDGLRAEVAAFRTTYALGGVYSTLNATGTADGESATLTYALKRQRDDSIYLTGGYTHKTLNDNVLGVSIADRTIDLGTVGNRTRYGRGDSGPAAGDQHGILLHRRHRRLSRPRAESREYRRRGHGRQLWQDQPDVPGDLGAEREILALHQFQRAEIAVGKSRFERATEPDRLLGRAVFR